MHLPSLRVTWISLTTIILTGCAITPFPTLPTPGSAGQQAIVYPLERGWYGGETIWYYNLGSNTPLDPAAPERARTEPVWVFVSSVNVDGSPVKLEGQDSLFDTQVGDADYSDLWQVVFVTPPASYEPNTLRSAAELAAAGLTASPQELYINCPEVPAGSSLVDDSLNLKTGWVRGEQVTYFDFGPTNPQPGNVYALVTGFAADGTPQLVAGQRLVFDAVPGAASYSDFWRVQWVTVAGAYAANTIRAVAEIDPAQVTASNLVMNFPHQ